MQSCVEASSQLEEAQHTLGAAEAHQIRLKLEASKLKKVRTTMEDMNWKIYQQARETYRIWKTMELDCNKQVEQAHMASQVWEVLQIQSKCQLFEQNLVTEKAIETELEAHEKMCQAAKTLRTVYNHVEQLQDQYWEHEDEHNERIEAVRNALHRANEHTQQARDRYVDLLARLEV
jgi:hypothetical protein